MWLAAMRLVPGVEGGLNRIALFEKFAIARREVDERLLKADPKFRGINAGTRQNLTLDEVREDRRHLQPALRRVVDHRREIPR